jgi:hypothetical protein
MADDIRRSALDQALILHPSFRNLAPGCSERIRYVRLPNHRAYQVCICLLASRSRGAELKSEDSAILLNYTFCH